MQKPGAVGMSDPRIPAVGSYDAVRPLDVDEPDEIDADPGCCMCGDFLACCLTSSLLGCFCSIKQVNVNEENVLLLWGKYYKTIRSPGLYCVACCGVTTKLVSVKWTTIDLKSNKVADSNGNPLILDGVVTYKVRNSKKATLDVQDANRFVQTQATAVIRQVAARYPYESTDGGPCLKNSSQHLMDDFVSSLQAKVNVAGIIIKSFDLTDVSYAPEIAQAMLARQQAQAVLAARRYIVQGAVEISLGATEALGARGVALTGPEKSSLISNLLTVLSGETKVSPVIPLSSASH
mmetsp:Transcript_18798/g.32373  ORF Transcript_18798/g.32373 Transcript_18798/m.32373 type:complete len:292 (+) Transcript_18798:62-937(+)